MRGFEPPTPWSVAKCSVQLSYTHILIEKYSITVIAQSQPTAAITTTAQRRETGIWTEKRKPAFKGAFKVPQAGLEPARCHHHGILNPARLPIPPLRQTVCHKTTRKGLEPSASAVTGRRSNQLSHRALLRALRRAQAKRCGRLTCDAAKFF